MIKINLLAEGKRPTAVRRTRQASVLEGQHTALLLLLVGFIVVGLLPSAAWWWLKSNEIASNEEEITVKQQEVDELAAIIREVEEYERKQADLRRKIDVINQLRANQRGPVQVMDAVSRAVPELLWLDRMDMNSTSITISGRAFNTLAISSFIENLDRVPEFEEPVFKDMQRQDPVYNYSIVFNYSFAVESDNAVEAAAGG